MGEHGKVKSARWKPEMERRDAEIADALFPAFQGFSERQGFVYRIAHAILCGGEIIEFAPALQRLLRTTSFTQVPSAVGGKPGPVKIGQSELGREKISRPAEVRAVGELERSAPWGFSFRKGRNLWAA